MPVEAAVREPGVGQGRGPLCVWTEPDSLNMLLDEVYLLWSPPSH
jgi:hypothetical protein